MNNNTNKSDDIFRLLSGYFPKEFDKTPDELEKDISNGVLKRTKYLKISDEEAKALSAAPLPQKKPQQKPKQKPPQKRESEHFTAENIKNPDDAVVYEFTAPTVEAEADNDIIIDIINETDNHVPEDVYVPVSNDVSEIELLRRANSLDELFEDLEDNDETPISENNGDELTSLRYELENEYEEGTDDNMRKVVNWFFDFLEIFSVCMTVIILLFSFVFRLTRVEGQSMENTLLDGQYLVVSDLCYTPKVGDIVVIQNTSLDEIRLREPIVKRIIGVAGETIQVDANGHVIKTTADGETFVLDEDYKKLDYAVHEPYYGTVIPEGYVFVMGDNRDHSADSRYGVGLVDIDCIFGKAIMRILPVSDFTLFENPFNEVQQ